MAFQEEKFEFEINLKKATRHWLKILDRVNLYPKLFEHPLLTEAIWRYECLWLPLAAQHHDQILVAPLDVELVWNCHMISPADYENDCKKFFGRVVNHEITSPEHRDKEIFNTKELWQKVYPDVPFGVHKLKDTSTFMKKNYPESKLSCDLKRALYRFKVFYYQVFLPHYRDGLYLEKAVTRYKKFLFLKSEYSLSQTPCYDINVVWRTHMLHPIQYKSDMMKIFGELLDHEDSIIDNNPGSRLYDTDVTTRTMWKEVFGENFSVCGSMFRGTPPNRRLYELTEQDRWCFCTLKTVASFSSLKVDGLMENGKSYSVGLSAKTRHKYMFGAFELDDKVFSVKGNKPLWRGDCLGKLKIDSRFKSFLNVCVKEKSKSKFLASSTKVVGTSRGYDCDQILVSINKEKTTPFTVNVHLNPNDGIHVSMMGMLSVPMQGMSVFFLEQGSFELGAIPDKVENFWGPVPLPYVPPGTKKTCNVAGHRFPNHEKLVQFTSKIIHSLPLMMSAVQIFYQDKLSVVSHLIDLDQLPLPSLVASHHHTISLDPREGERAMLIKNNQGDWAVCVGKWEGFTKGCPGYLKVKVFKLPFTGEIDIINLESAFLWKKDYIFKTEHMSVDLEKGLIEIFETTRDVPEHLALALTVAVLQTLLQPKPEGWKPINQTADKSDKKIEVTASTVALILAAGFMVVSPANYFLRNKFKSHVGKMYGHDKKQEQLEQQEEEDELRLRENSSHDELLERRLEDDNPPEVLYSNLLNDVRDSDEESRSGYYVVNPSGDDHSDTSSVVDKSESVSGNDDKTDIVSGGDDTTIAETHIVNDKSSYDDVVPVYNGDIHEYEDKNEMFADNDYNDSRDGYIDNSASFGDNSRDNLPETDITFGGRDSPTGGGFSDSHGGYDVNYDVYADNLESFGDSGGGFGDNGGGFGDSGGGYGDSGGGFGDSGGGFGESGGGFGESGGGFGESGGGFGETGGGFGDSGGGFGDSGGGFGDSGGGFGDSGGGYNDSGMGFADNSDSF